MALLDELAILREDGVGFRTAVCFESDAGVWVDFNAVNPDAAATSYDYHDGLLAEPTITAKIESSGKFYVAQLSSISMDNSPWANAESGLFDSVLPVTVRGQVFSFWERRKVQIGVAIFLPGSDQLYQDVTLGTFLIDQINTSEDAAEITLAPIHSQWQEVEAAAVKDGSRPYEGWTISNLIRRLLRHADPNADLSGIPDRLVFGTIPTSMISSYGPTPGAAYDASTKNGNRAPAHWIPRVMGIDLFEATENRKIMVGFEVPGVRPRPDGALAEFYDKEGTWRILAGPDNASLLHQWTPCAIYPYSTLSGTRFLAYQENIDETKAFYKLKLFQVSPDGSSTTAIAGPWNVWICRDVYRKGMYFTDLGPSRPGRRAFVISGSLGFGGIEPIHSPFMQVVDELSRRVWSHAFPTTYSTESYVAWTGYHVEQGDWSFNERAFTEYPTGARGILNAARCDFDDQANYYAFFRYRIGTDPTFPILWTTGATRAFVWIGQSSSAFYFFSIYKLDMTTLAVQEMQVSFGTTPSQTQFWRKQVSAYCWDVEDASNTRLLVHCIDRDESVANVRHECYLYTVNVLWGTGANVVGVWDNNITGQGSNGCIVRLWSPSDLTTSAYRNEYGKRPGAYAVAVVLQRYAKEQGPTFGIGVWNKATQTWVELFSDDRERYTGPVSGMPFSNFAEDPDNPSSFYFIDQASGQVWRATVTGSTSVSYALQNDGGPAHGSEFCASTPTGLAHSPAWDSYLPRLWFGLAPSPPGEVTCPNYRERVDSRALQASGVYPLVSLSRSVPDIIEVADCEGLKVFDALAQLVALTAGAYRFKVSGTGTLTIERRTASASPPVLVPLTEYGVANLEDGEIPAFGKHRKFSIRDTLVNSVEVVPWGVRPKGEPETTPIKSARSKWAGTYLIDCRGKDALTLSISCVTGGDILDNVASGGTGIQSGILWRWTRVLPTVTAYLLINCSSGQTSIQVSGLVTRAGRFYAGDVEVGVGDYVTVGDGSRLTITSIGSAGSINAIVIGFGVAVGISASAGTAVMVEPSSRSSISDGENGVTNLAVAISTSDTILSFANDSQLRPGMIVQMIGTTGAAKPGLEYIELLRRNADSRWTVGRARFRTVALTIAQNTVVRAYLWTRQNGKLYEVGDSGIYFGLNAYESTEEDTGGKSDPIEKESRTVAPGDGILVRTQGSGLQALEQVRIREVDTASIAAKKKKEKKVEDNRFVDLPKAKLLATTLLTPDSLVGVDGVEIPFCTLIEMGSTVRYRSARKFPVLGYLDMEVIEVAYDLRKHRMRLSLRSYVGFTGKVPGKVGEEDTGPTGMPSGNRGDDE